MKTHELARRLLEEEDKEVGIESECSDCGFHYTDVGSIKEVDETVYLSCLTDEQQREEIERAERRRLQREEEERIQAHRNTVFQEEWGPLLP